MTYPGWQSPPPKSHTLRTVLIIVGAVLVLCCGGGVIGAFHLFHAVSKATTPPRDATDEFVTDLENGNNTAAYGMLCSDTQSAFTLSAFATGVTGQPKIVRHKIGGVNVVNTAGHSTAVVEADLTTDSGFVDQHSFPLVKEGGRWRVCGRPY
jgi:hypothetical protein